MTMITTAKIVMVSVLVTHDSLSSCRHLHCCCPWSKQAAMFSFIDCHVLELVREFRCLASSTPRTHQLSPADIAALFTTRCLPLAIDTSSRSQSKQDDLFIHYLVGKLYRNRCLRGLGDDGKGITGNKEIGQIHMDRLVFIHLPHKGKYETKPA